MSQADQISELLLEWDELREQGRDITPAELCRDCPNLTEEVARRIEALRAVYAVPNGLGAGGPDDQTLGAVPTGSRPGPLVVPGYDILGELGSGGMGVVYLARQVKLKRSVALKVILSGARATPEQLARFRTEAESAARLHHPNIVQIYEVGEHEGVPYLALEYVEGGTLAQQLSAGPLPPRQAAELARVLAGAIHHAHERGVVHRDLKPANILLAACGLATDGDSAKPQAAEAVPKIADFGLAKRLDEDTGQTRTGAVMGTPSYMAPEQAAGQVSAIGPATDVYALGAILYEMLTGRPPFQAANVLDTLDQVRSHDPVPPRFLQPQLPADLETVCLKCLQKDPDHRYASAAALAEDLRRFLDGEPIQARSVNLLEQLSRLLNRSQRLTPGRDIFPAVIMGLGSLPLLVQGLLFLLVGGQPFYGGAAVVTALLTGMLLILVLYRFQYVSQILMPVAANRQIWSSRLALLMGVLALTVISYQLAPPEGWDPLTVFPLWNVVAGVIMFSMGGSFWGRMYLIGVGLVTVGLLMPLFLPWAALVFGLSLTVTLELLGLHVHRQVREAARERVA